MPRMIRWACPALLVCALTLDSMAQGPPPPPPPVAPPARPLQGLSPAEVARWQAGQSAFVNPVTPQGGLGPVFNEGACVACHGGAASTGGPGPRLVTRFARYPNGVYDPMTEFGGPTLQDKGIGAFNGVFFQGETVPPQATWVTKRRTTTVQGLGLVEAVPDVLFTGLAAYQKQHTPTLAGRPNFVFDPANGQPRVGRFGWKAQQPTLFAFSGDALLNEMGVTTPLFPVENCPEGNCQLLAANPAKANPNQSTTATIQQLADFMAFNAPPTPPPGPLSPDAAAGQATFSALGCAVCHQPALMTWPSPTAPLNNALFFPYSDFLLHDMSHLGDGMEQGQSQPSEMRTAPLWGLRFNPFFLHDGRAPTPDAAIIAHDGQGKAASIGYQALTPTKKAQLLAFLNTL